MDFAIPANYRIKLKKYKKKDKCLDLARELKKKLWNMKVTIVPIVIGAFDTVTKWLLKSLEHLEVGGCRVLPNDNIIEDGQNTEKSPGDIRRLAVTQTPGKSHQLTLMWKTLKEYIIIIIIITTITRDKSELENYLRQNSPAETSWK